MNLIAEFNLDWLADNSGYIMAGLIVLVGIAVGLPDLLRLSIRRIWAIGSVGFRESMRRRVLWVTPLAMLGIIAVTQLSHPIDEQDAIRQATKYCLFASGLVVVIATLILACTNLPKEIDTRVIYTIVTKPATRLEIVLGKTVAFARTSAVILLIMGLFSYVYLHINEAQLSASVQGRLKALPPGDPGRETLQHYANDGLLQSRTYERPPLAAWGERPMMQVMAPPPVAEKAKGATGSASTAKSFRWPSDTDPFTWPSPDDQYRWTFGAEEQNVLFPFKLPDFVASQPDALLQISLNLQVVQRAALNRRELEQERLERDSIRPTTRGAPVPPVRPKITVSLLNADGFTAATAMELMDARHPLEDAKAIAREDFRNANQMPLEPGGAANSMEARVTVPPKAMNRIRQLPQDADGSRRLYVMVVGPTLATLYGFADDAVTVTAVVTAADGKAFMPALPQADESGRRYPPVFRGRESSAQNQQLRGDPDLSVAPIAVYEFRNAPPEPGGGDVEFEFRTRIERGGSDRSDAENVTNLDVVVFNRKSKFTSDPIRLTPDSDRATLFRVPRAAVEGGDFDLRAQCRTQGHYVGLRPPWLGMVASTQTFAVNLLKSLTILWMLSILVVIISIFCSTFLSWPIAIVLALVMLLGRWCVMQLGEQTSPAQMTVDLFGQTGNAPGARVFTDTMRALNQFIAILSKVLPNLDHFRVTSDIERGVTIPYQSLLDPLWVLGGYGVPVLILSYLFLRKKEVAP